jgi:ribosome-associated protein
MLGSERGLATGPGTVAQPSEDDVLSDLSLAAGATAAGAVPLMAGSHDVSSDVLLGRILQSLDDDKAEDVVSIDLRGRSSVADHMVICSGRSSRQVGAIAEKLTERLKEEFGRTSKVEGKETGDWVLIDTGDVIVHVFRPEVRDFYQLEKMWMPATQGFAPRAAKA